MLFPLFVEGHKVHYRLRMWFVMESRKMVAWIQRNVFFFFFLMFCCCKFAIADP